MMKSFETPHLRPEPSLAAEFGLPFPTSFYLAKPLASPVPTKKQAA